VSTFGDYLSKLASGGKLSSGEISDMQRLADTQDKLVKQLAQILGPGGFKYDPGQNVSGRDLKILGNLTVTGDMDVQQDNGWNLASHPWVYASATSITIPGFNDTAFYKPGVKLKYNDGSVDYGTVLSSSYAGGNTTVNVVPNADYSIADPGGTHALTGCYYSYGNPPDFPDTFAFTPTWASDSNPQPAIVNGTISGKFRVEGKKQESWINLLMGASTTYGTGVWRISLPFGATASINVVGDLIAYDSSTAVSPAGSCRSAITETSMTGFFGNGFLSSTVPFTWAQNDKLELHISALYA
jgi:hypothetical protein